MSKLITIGCGGAGMNILSRILEENIHPDAATLVPYFVDTSDANITSVPDEHKLFKMETVKSTEDELAGSGGERKSNVDTIKHNVKVFVDSLPMKKVGDFYVVIGSLSGGSASVIAPLLTVELLKRDMPTLVIAIGDSKSELTNLNTSNTLQTYVALSKMVNKPISMMYFNNTAPDGDESTRIKAINDKVVLNYKGLSVMVSSTNHDMDYSDMASLLDVSKYSTIEVPNSGINILTFHTKDISDGTENILISRAITTQEASMVDVASKHDKTGYLRSPELIKTLGNNVPLILTSSVGLIPGLLNNIDEIDKEFKKLNKDLMANTDIDVGECDDDGLVF